MNKNLRDLINFVMRKKGFKERLKYFLKLFVYLIPIIYALSGNQEETESSASQAGDDIYPIF